MFGSISSLDWQGILKIAALSGIVSSILVAFGAWLVLRFTKASDSYLEALAQQLVRHQHLDELVEETRRLTRAAEMIKSELSQENWDRQTRFLAKRDLYVKVAEALCELRDAYVVARGLERSRVAGAALAPDHALFKQKRTENLQKVQDATAKFSQVTATGPLMMPDAPFKPLREFAPHKVRYGTSNWERDIELNIEKVRWALYHFQVAARADLGFGPMEWKPILIDDPPKDDELPETKGK
jgi:hypothetical protein